MEIPANLPVKTALKAQEIAVAVFKVLACEGMARIDMFVTSDGEVMVNEINTIPEFTKISIYPKLWEASGLGYTDLVTRLIELTIERDSEKRALTSSYI